MKDGIIMEMAMRSPVAQKLNKVNRKTKNDKGIIRPKKTRKDPGLGPDVILAMIRSDLEVLLSLTRREGIRHYDMEVFQLYQATLPDGRPLALAGPFIGAPHAVMGMEKVIALGAERIWAFGWCGSLQPSLAIGDLVIPTRALSEEGTSRHYPIDEREAATDESLNRAVERSLQAKGHPFTKGPVWTTDAPYRETAGKVNAFQKQGILAVEMEMSALMTLAAYRKARLSGCLVVSDELSDLTWRPGFSSPRRKEGSRSAGAGLLDAIESFEDFEGI